MIHNTDLDDIYDRMFFRVVQKKAGPQKGLVCIYDRGRRSFRNSAVETMPPSVIMDFGPKGLSLGSIAVGQMPPMPMKDYLRKMGTWGSSYNRKFVASNSCEYRWTRGVMPGQAWTCLDPGNRIIAHYALKDPQESPAYRTSGNAFVVEESLLDISAELLATLIIMRHIEKYRL